MPGRMRNQTQMLPLARRLICTADANRVQVVSSHRVQMITPPSEPLDDLGEQTGFWIEVRDAHEHVQYRRIMANPVEEDVEVPGDPQERTFTRHSVAGARTFALLVPEQEDSDHVALMLASPTPGNSARARRTEIARLPLRNMAADASDTGGGEK